MADRTTSCKDVTVHYNVAVEDAYGDNLLSGLHLMNTKTGKWEIPADANTERF